MEIKKAGQGYDLRELQGSESLHEAFSKLLSGKANYKTVVEIKKPKCKCGHELKGTEKFCPECGNQLIIK